MSDALTALTQSFAKYVSLGLLLQLRAEQTGKGIFTTCLGLNRHIRIWKNIILKVQSSCQPALFKSISVFEKKFKSTEITGSYANNNKKISTRGHLTEA